ncbi:MAG: hypothetical protein HFJ72_08435 [Adlercreutzia sp.]|nr:hypothetical protein [Adlercreutzia sp.]
MLNGKPYLTPTTAENAEERVRELARWYYDRPGNPLIAEMLSITQAEAAQNLGFAWEEVERWEAEAYRAAEKKASAA